MKAAGQYSPVVLSIMLHKVVLSLGYVDKTTNVTIEMKATERYVLSCLAFEAG